MNVWIIESSSGLKLLYKSFMKITVNNELLSGLLSAFNQFTMVEFQQPIESIEMAGLRWIYILDAEHDLLYIAADTKDITAYILRARLSTIKDSFIKEFEEIWKTKGKQWDGNLRIYDKFNQIIEKIYFQWEDAEIMNVLADFYDLLGIFQQLFNLIQKILISYISERQKEEIYQKVEEFFNTFKNESEVKDDPELQKLYFEREKGINIFKINPTKCDPLLVKVFLVNLLTEIINIMKNQLGEDLTIKYFRMSKVFHYIFNNWILIRHLNLEPFLIKQFILI